MPRSAREIGRPAPKSKRGVAAALLALAVLAGCASTGFVEGNRPLPGAERNAVERLVDANRAGGRQDLVVLVSFSGGGKRSSAFGHGVLRGMREVPVAAQAGGPPTSLLSEVDQLAGVSGGSFPAAHYALNGEASFETFGAEFLSQDINNYIIGTFLLPWNWAWLVNPLAGTNDRMARVYDRLMFRGATFADLATRLRPALSVNATDIAFGVPFAFGPANFDLLCSDLASFSVARAVAASNGFPGLFTPITLENHRGPGCTAPAPIVPDLASTRADLRTRQLAQTMQRYLDPERTKWVHLMDGGISDNLALRATLNSLILLERQAERFTAQMRPIRRVLVISVDGQAAADPELPRRRVAGGLFAILGAVSGTQIDNYNVETLLLAEAQLERLRTRLRATRCAQGPRIDGHACDDVAVQLVHLALTDLPDEAVRRRLQAIPTGLTVGAADVAALLAAGEAAARGDPELRAFLAR